MNRFIVLFCVVLSGCAQLTNPPYTSFSDGVDWMVAGPLRYEVGNSGYVIEVPEGFVTDFASSPWWAWQKIPRIGTYQFAAVVHDYLYWEHNCEKIEADQILYHAMKEAGVPLEERSAIYAAVRAKGQEAWDENLKLRAKGLPRVIPAKYRNIPPLVLWKEYQAQLVQKGVRAPPRAKRAAYCSALTKLSAAERDW